MTVYITGIFCLSDGFYFPLGFIIRILYILRTEPLGTKPIRVTSKRAEQKKIIECAILNSKWNRGVGLNKNC